MTRWFTNRFALFLLLPAIAACEQQHQYRTQVLADDGTPIICDIHIDQTERQECGTSFIQRRHYRDAEGEQQSYYMAFVEFDDQGWFHDRNQLEGLIRFLKDGNAVSDGSGKNDYLLFVYAHGWKHNAKACDDNIVCFARQLERFAAFEREHATNNTAFGQKPRTVVGVYIGWRGLSLNLPLLNNLSFWERKNTAQRVGRGNVSEVLTRLSDFRKTANCIADPNAPGHCIDGSAQSTSPKLSPTMLAIIGHSFGAQIIYSAISHHLLGQLVSSPTVDDKFRIAREFADLVVLINPAFEASAYQPLHDAATSRCYLEGQKPIMLIVTSEADLATGKTLPIGRRLSNLFEGTRPLPDGTSQYDAIIQAVGHYEPQRTHFLGVPDGPPADGQLPDTPDCGCPYLPETTIEILETSIDEDKKVLSGFPETSTGWYTRPDNAGFNFSVNYGSNVIMQQTSELASNHPLFVLKTDKTLVPGHNEIYDRVFTDFFRRFFVVHIMRSSKFPNDNCPGRKNVKTAE